MIWLILIYIMSTISARQVFKLLFTYNWKSLNPNISDILIVFFPLVNTVIGIFGWVIIDFPNKKKDLGTKFFNLKYRE